MPLSADCSRCSRLERGVAAAADRTSRAHEAERRLATARCNYAVAPRLRWSSGRSFYDSSAAWLMDEQNFADAQTLETPRRPFGFAFTAGVGALTLQGTSISPVTLDFGTLGGSTLVFNSLNILSAGTYVNILNWSGTAFSGQWGRDERPLALRQQPRLYRRTTGELQLCWLWGRRDAD